MEFLERFFEGAQYDIELRSLPLRLQHFSRDQSSLDGFIERFKQTNLYFGCCTRKVLPGEEEPARRGDKLHCAEMVALWADIDFDEIKGITRASAETDLAAFPFKPSILINSGGGLHVYWLLNDIHDAQDPRCERILGGIAVALNSDAAVKDISRVLRVPGTRNFKTEYKPPREVLIEKCDWSLRYNFSEFEMYEQIEPPHVEIEREERTGKIKKGDRTKAIVSLAGLLNYKGNTIEEIVAAALGMNSTFDPPLAEKSVRQHVDGIVKRYEKQHGEGTPLDGEIKRTIQVITADTIEPEPLMWLWENRVPMGKLTVFCGMPDTGKSTVGIDIAARLTTGTPWPDSDVQRDPCDVLMLISEDDLEDTVVPRLIAAGARLSQIHFAKQTVVEQKGKRKEIRIALDEDLKALEELLIYKPEIKLLIADPLGSYLGKLKKNAEEDIRHVLTEMKELAEKTNVAIISIDHFNKNVDQSAIHRLSGAGALAAVPRAVWAFVKDTEDETKVTRLMLNAKLNVVSEGKKAGLKYRSVGMEISIKNVTASLPIIQWGGESTSDLDEVLQKQADKDGKKVTLCARWLKGILEKGSEYSSEIYMQGEKAGFKVATIRRAAKDLDVKPFQVGKRWKMELYSESSSYREPGEDL